MRPTLWIACAGLALAITPAADAQMFGHHPTPPQQGDAGGPHTMNCDQIAAMPNAGMDRATCEQMNQAATAYRTGANDPAAARPGDEAMTCDDIKAELMQQTYTPPPAEHVASAQAAGRDYMAKSGELQAEANAMAMSSAAENTAASVAAMVNPIAGRAAEAAAAAHQEAEQKALNAKAKAELQPRYHTLMSSTGTLVGDMTPQLQSNPRLARLISLAQEKHCHGM